jgi:hypothetical protein
VLDCEIMCVYIYIYIYILLIIENSEDVSPEKHWWMSTANLLRHLYYVSAECRYVTVSTHHAKEDVMGKFSYSSLHS